MEIFGLYLKLADHARRKERNEVFAIVRETHGMREDEKSAITHVYDTLRPKTITRFVNIILFSYYVTHNHHQFDSELINSCACLFAI